MTRPSHLRVKSPSWALLFNIWAMKRSLAEPILAALHLHIRRLQQTTHVDPQLFCKGSLLLFNNMFGIFVLLLYLFSWPRYSINQSVHSTFYPLFDREADIVITVWRSGELKTGTELSRPAFLLCSVSSQESCFGSFFTIGPKNLNIGHCFGMNMFVKQILWHWGRAGWRLLVFV